MWRDHVREAMRKNVRRGFRRREREALFLGARHRHCVFLGARPGRSLTARDADVGVGTNARVPPPSVSELPGRRNEDVPVAS